MDIQELSAIGSLLWGVILIIIVLVSLSVHEFAHAFVANLFGDPTAKLEGRLSLNPLRHWDPIGTTLLVGLLFLRIFGLPLPVFGWGKPVPVDERNFENPRIYGLQTALAGPMSNFILAILLALAVRYVPMSDFAGSLVITGIYLNIFLMFFNLLPIPPLDGSRLLRLFLPESTYQSLATNPLFFVIFIFIVIYFLLDLLIVASSQLSSFLIG